MTLAHPRGELPNDTDVELAIDLLVGGLLLLRRLTGRLRRSDPTPERAVDILLAGLASGGRR